MENEQLSDPNHSKRSTPPLVIAAWTLMGLVFVFVFGAKLLIGGNDRSLSNSQDLPVYGAVPDVELVDSGGEPFSTGDLLGRVWVASLFFTRCSAACPMMASQLARFQEAMPNPEVALVSISVDPERDTPEELSKYAEAVGARPEKWRFLTGEMEKIVDLAENHLKLGTGQDREDYSTHSDEEEVPESAVLEEDISEFRDETLKEIEEGLDEWDEDAVLARDVVVVNPILHSDRFALVDQEGRIRGYYDGKDEKEVAHLQADAERLLDEGKR